MLENLHLVFEKNKNLIFIVQFSMHECAVRKIKIIDFIYEDENKLKVKKVFAYLLILNVNVLFIK